MSLRTQPLPIVQRFAGQSFFPQLAWFQRVSKQPRHTRCLRVLPVVLFASVPPFFSFHFHCVSPPFSVQGAPHSFVQWFVALFGAFHFFPPPVNRSVLRLPPLRIILMFCFGGDCPEPLVWPFFFLTGPPPAFVDRQPRHLTSSDGAWSLSLAFALVQPPLGLLFPPFT